ncbi:MAG: DinB family protein [Gemmatimonadota bacterium]|nr:DinB family protein [Gemmatimonadota bacterium]MDE3174030.1 DinB family protein [Gemmatimonadota bacterium]MDE3217087.1 DinB family protein [Gemmatimonadota bacterium]
MSVIQRPAAGEYAPFYAGYVDGVPEGDVVEILERQGRELAALLAGVAGDRGDYRYAPDKWTVKEVVGHIADAERIFAYRALRIARGDATPLPSFDQDGYVERGGFARRTLTDLAAEFSAVRAATLALFRAMTDEESRRVGTASNAAVSARGLAYIAAGHERHHSRILRERYLK